MANCGDKEWNRLGGIINARSVDEVNEAYTHWAASYDEDVEKLFFIGNASLAEGSIEHIQNEDSTLMLDVAAGTGKTAESYRDVGFKGIIDAIDINAAMLENAKKKGLYRNTTCQKVTADEPLKVEQGSYDVVTICGAMHDHHVPFDCIPRILDALKPGGKLVFNSRITAKNSGYQTQLRHLLERLINDGEISIVKEDIVPYHDVQDNSKPKTALLFILLTQWKQWMTHKACALFGFGKGMADAGS